MPRTLAILAVFQRTSRIRERRQTAVLLYASSDNYLLGVGIHDQVWVVSDEKDLTSEFGSSKVARQEAVNRFVVEIFFRLIDQKRSSVLLVHREVQDQQNYALRAWREIFEWGAVIAQSVR